MIDTLVKPLFNLPESIHKIGFVEVLSEAIDRPEQTAATYVVTPALVAAFERTLRSVGASLKDSRSRAAFLHGSFGSGKSHFMALLSLLLDGNEDAWRIPELHPLREKVPFVGSKKLLQLHFHMVGQESIEEAIFLRYLAHVRTRHPKATVPGLFADEKLFADARSMLEELGDGAFFKPMNPAGAGDDDWGSFGGSRAWDRERFERCATSTEPKEREELLTALVKTRFRAFAEESRQFVALDAGLGIIGRHAKGLGYDGVVLFLDELILWLASRASNVAWFHNEAQKIVKLVEAEDAHREIPFVSFIARQRDLAEMVGENYMGLENKLVRDSLQWSEGRYETVTLEDRNLPAIVEKRVLRPKNDAAVKVLDEAFAKLKKGAADPAWRTLLGSLDAQDFRRLYPFSPVLIDALVALSNALQRERTAIKLLTELLVEHIDDLNLGEVVAVGDLYDVLAGGGDTADGIMKARFEAATQMYTYRLLPVLQEAHGTNTAERCQRLRPEHPARLGCSGCRVTACRTDNRLVKTLIIAALVPEVKALKDLTASRLVQLNHGSLRVPIPGTEVSLVTQKLKSWANQSQVGQLHIGTQADPTVRLQLEGVELGPIMKQAEGADSPGAQQKVLRDLLFDAMGIEKVLDWGKDLKHKDWRGTDRMGHVRFGNVRKMGPELLRCPDDHDWRLVVDFPFDEAGYGPHDDEAVLDRFREEHGGSWTLVWLPSFFSHTVKQMLKDLVILEHILANPRGYVSHLSVENQTRAVNDLTNLRSTKQSHVMHAIEQAYGLAQQREEDLDASLSIDKHLHVLKPGAALTPALAANLATALDAFVPALLEARYPRHPRLTQRLTKDRVERLVAKFGDIVDSEDKRIPADRTLVDEMRGTLGELGLVRVTETAVHLVEDRTLQELEKKRQQRTSERPEVSEIQQLFDENHKMGLQPEALDLVVRCYARWSARTFVSGGQAFVVTPGKPIPDHVVLEKPDLPSHEVWNQALAMAGVFGVTLPGKALHADNLKRFEAEVGKCVKLKAPPCAQLAAHLKKRLEQLGLALDADRLKTAASAEKLCTALLGRPGKELCETLARFQPQTSQRAVGQSIGSAEKVAAVLADNLVFGAFTQLAARQSLEGASELLEHAGRCLRQDELNEAASERLRALAEQALRLMSPAQPAAGAVVVEGTLRAQGKAAVLAELERAAVLARTELEDEGDDVVLAGSFTITRRGR